VALSIRTVRVSRDVIVTYHQYKEMRLMQMKKKAVPE
jgi:hypothetical protein